MMKKYTKSYFGFTLIEIIIAIAILSIIIIAILNVFTFGLTSLFSAGDKSRTVAELDGIVQNVIEQLDTSYNSSQTDIENFLVNTMNFNLKSGANVMIKDAGKDINCYVGPRQVIQGTNTYGYAVTFVKFYGSKQNTCKITIFITEGGV